MNRVRLSSKGGLTIDKVAHTMMEFRPAGGAYGTTREDGYEAFYHEEELFSIRNLERGTVTLVYAKSPHEAINKVRREATA